MKRLLIVFLLMVPFVYGADYSPYRIAYWDFEDDGNDEWNNIDLTEYGGINYVGTPTGRGATFDGSSDYFRNSNSGIADYFEDDSASTVVAIIYLNTNANHRALFSVGKADNAGADVIELSHRDNDHMQVLYQDSSSYNTFDSNQIVVNEGNWICVAAVWNTSTDYGIIYKNDSSRQNNLKTVQSEYSALGNLMSSISDGVTVGSFWRRSSTGEQYFDGTIDKMWVYDAAVDNESIYNLCKHHNISGILDSIYNINCSSAFNNIEPYLTPDVTPTFTFNTNKYAECRISGQNLSFSSMGIQRSCTTTNISTHTCTIISADELDNGENTIFISCREYADNSNILNRSINVIAGYPAAIENGIQNSEIWPDVDYYPDQKIYMKNLSGSVVSGTLDYYLKHANKRWLFNYIEVGETSLSLFNITPNIYSREYPNSIDLNNLSKMISGYINDTK